MRCRAKNHSQWFSPKSKPNISSTSTLPSQSIKPQKRKWEDTHIKEETDPPEKKKKATAIISIRAKIYKLESMSMNMNKT
jgi:hypothetical protein